MAVGIVALTAIVCHLCCVLLLKILGFFPLQARGNGVQSDSSLSVPLKLYVHELFSLESLLLV